MRKIEFIAGYYEWHLLVDGKLVWVEHDGDVDTLYENEEYKKVIKDLQDGYLGKTTFDNIK